MRQSAASTRRNLVSSLLSGREVSRQKTLVETSQMQ
jgi:hypothetical protein